MNATPAGRPAFEQVDQPGGFGLHRFEPAGFGQRVEERRAAQVDRLVAAEEGRGQQGLHGVAQNGAHGFGGSVPASGADGFQAKSLLRRRAQPVGDFVGLARGGEIVAAMDQEQPRRPSGAGGLGLRLGFPAGHGQRVMKHSAVFSMLRISLNRGSWVWSWFRARVTPGHQRLS